MAHWLQGLFFQEMVAMDIEHRSESEGGSQVVLHEGIGQFMFNGALWQDPNGIKGTLSGHLEDRFGRSKLTHVELDANHFVFAKRYHNRPPIHYTFRFKEGLTWVGEWSGRDAGRGIARCLLTEVPDEFFWPESVLAALKAAKK